MTEKTRERELRMYFLVMYNISPIQQAIQAGHCVEEYADKYGDTDLYKEYRKHKTWIILNGGTSNNGLIVDFVNESWVDETKLGSMETYEKYLIDNNIPFASFREPDLNNALSSLCFICDEKVFDWKNYPTFEKWLENNGCNNVSAFFTTPYDVFYDLWTRFVGGEQNAKLKELIYGKKLA